MKAPSDQEALLIREARQGDQAAFEELVRIHQRRVYAVALRMLGNPDDAEDVLQETFLALHRRLGSFRGRSRLSTYLYRSAANFSLMKLRQRRAKKTASHVALDQAEESPDPRAFSLDGYIDSELRAVLDRHLQELPGSERTAVVLRDIEGLPGREVARILSVTVAAMKSRLHHGRERLRRKLAPYFYRN
jgi:RNA polymerase sigma-70 factor (ECF subfamily)